jgi:hypothetical protein
MNFTNTDRAKIQVYGQFHSWNAIWQVCGQIYWQVFEQLNEHLDQQIKPMQNTIKQEIRK